MSGAPTPPVLLEAIASSAPTGSEPGDKTSPIPDAPTGSNAASVQGGFPAITMESELGGGLPPLGQDMNGFLFLLSSHTLYAECGQLYQYNPTLATKIGGYARGTVLGMADGTGVWLNTVDANTSNPDTEGAGWVPVAANGIGSVATTGGTVTVSAAQARYPVIFVFGVLTSNVSLNLPNRLGSWLVVNGTVGSFTMVAKTAASGSTGVTVPQAGYSAPVGVYCVADGNIYPTVSPLSVPIDQSPDPLTLVERTNAGYVLATYFNQNSGVENPSITNVIVDAGDGFFRKIAKANFNSQISPSGSNANGRWEVRPSGVIEQYGSITRTTHSGVQTVPFPANFPTACDGVWLETVANSIGWDTWVMPTPTTSSFQLNDDASGANVITINWRALGR